MRKDKWLTCGVSVIGGSHVEHNLPNQDAWLGYNDDGLNVLAVSDGVGSCIYAERGSTAACKAVLSAAKMLKRRTLDRRVLVRGIHSKWLEYIHPYEPDDCAATCLFAIRTEGRMLVGRLGDGFVAACTKSGANDFLLYDKKENSFINLTDALCSRHDDRLWEVKLLRERLYDHITICTDGLPFTGNELRFARDLHRQYAGMGTAAREKDMAGWLDAMDRSVFYDDKTVACLFRQGGQGERSHVAR